MSQYAISSDRPIYNRILDPLFHVVVNKSMSAPSRQPLYLRLIREGGQADRLEYTRDKSAANTSLHVLAQSFTTLTTSPSANFREFTLGDQIYQEIHSLQDSRMAAVSNRRDKEKLYNFVNVMTNYLNSYRETLFFRIGIILARIFPCLFDNPEAILQDRIASIARIRTFLEQHYGPPTNTNVASVTNV